MTYRIHVLLRSPRPVPAADIQDFIRDGVFLSRPYSVAVEPGREGERDGWDWRTIQVTHAADKAPIVIRLVDQASEIQTIVADALGEAEDRSSPDHVERLRVLLEQTRCVISLELRRPDLTDDTWFMVDALEGYLAQEREGLVWAEEDGLFDERLQRLTDDGR